MGGHLDKPKLEKHNEHGSGNGLSYGLSSMQGWRTEMEDAHCALVGLPQGLKDWSFFAVFDGHGSERVSAHCAENLLDTIIQAEDFRNNTNANNCDSHIIVEDVERVKDSIKDSFLRLDERMRKIPEIPSWKSGSTAVCILITSSHFYFANCGDSRAVLSRNEIPFFFTKDHKPINPVEKERIEKAGGYVRDNRVNRSLDSLGVCRALGDFYFKKDEGKGPCEQLVSTEPEVDVLERDNERDEFLILACDGVWDVIGNKEICDNTRYMMQITSDLEYICNCIIDACFGKGSKDNMSVVLVALPGAPGLNEELIREDQELNQRIEKRIPEIISTEKHADLSEIISILDKEESKKLPGIVYYKYSLIKEMFNKVLNNSSTKSVPAEQVKEAKEMDEISKNEDQLEKEMEEKGEPTEMDVNKPGGVRNQRKTFPGGPGSLPHVRGPRNLPPVGKPGNLPPVGGPRNLPPGNLPPVDDYNRNPYEYPLEDCRDKFITGGQFPNYRRQKNPHGDRFYYRDGPPPFDNSFPPEKFDEDYPPNEYFPERFPPEQERFLPHQRFPPDRKRFPSERERFPSEESMFPPDQEGFPPGPDRFPPGPERFPPGPKRFPRGSERFPRGQDRFPPDPERFSDCNDGFPPEDGRFPTDQGGFPPDQDNFPPNQERFHPAQERFHPGQDRFASGTGRFPPKNEKRFPPEDGFPPRSERYPPRHMMDEGRFGERGNNEFPPEEEMYRHGPPPFTDDFPLFDDRGGHRRGRGFAGRGRRFRGEFDRYGPPFPPRGMTDDFPPQPDDRFSYPGDRPPRMPPPRGMRPPFEKPGPFGPEERFPDEPPFFGDGPQRFKSIDYTQRPAAAVMGEDYDPHYDYESEFQDDVNAFRARPQKRKKWDA